MVRALAVLAAVLLVASPGPRRPASLGEQWAVRRDRARPPRRLAALAGRGVIVAVVDSGMRLNHPDLAPNLWTNPAEVPGNHRDDDGNGYVDDVHGVDLSGDGSTHDLRDAARARHARRGHDRRGRQRRAA